MRLLHLLLTVVFLLQGLIGTAQTISIAVKNTPLLKVFTEIEQQTDISFFYRVELLKKARKVTVKLTNASLSEVLDVCFKDQPLTYELIDKIVVVKEKMACPNRVETDLSTATLARQYLKCTARIVTAQGEPVEMATIAIKGKKKASHSNANGEFSINVDEDGSAVLTVTSVAIEPAEVVIKNDTTLTIIVQY
jgi:iron complex outermembrane receptor protein